MRATSLLTTLAAVSLAASSVTAHAISASGEPLNLRDLACKPIVKRNIYNNDDGKLERRQTQPAAGAPTEGQTPSGSGGASAARYSCDPNQCKLPNCRCADVKPPGNLAMSDVPQFITLTADDAVQSYTINALKKLMDGRKNPNGCPVTATYFTQLAYTNYSMVTDWYVAGNDVADHTVTHQAQPSIPEISGNLQALNTLAGIPFRSLSGFRAPYLNYTKQNLIDLHRMNFDYDSSSSSSVPVTDPNTDAFWPYTLDYGMANDCTSVEGICNGEPKLPGLWEVPMYSSFETPALPHLMDPWLDNPREVRGWMERTFMDHYNGNKQPFGLYSHPIHIATDYPGATGLQPMIDAINGFLDFAHSNTSMNNVWMVSNTQLLAWMKNPVPASQLNTLDEFKCQTPQVNQAVICNGMPDKQNTVLQHCISDDPNSDLNRSPFYTCYGCPSKQPTVDEPVPLQNNATGSIRTRISANCDTPFWDPIAGKCLNSGFKDETRSIGANGQGITSSGSTNTAADTTTKKAGDGYTCFSGACSGAVGAVHLPHASTLFGAMLAVGAAAFFA